MALSDYRPGDQVEVTRRRLAGVVHSYRDGILAIRLEGQRALFRVCFEGDTQLRP
jgi:hypothetical protein